MSQTLRQFAILTAVIILLTTSAMLLLLSTLSSPAAPSARFVPTTLAAPSPTDMPQAQSEPPAPAPNSAIALIIGMVSGFLVILLSLALLRAQRTSSEQ